MHNQTIPESLKAVGRAGADVNNIPNILGQITSALGESDFNILDMLNKSLGDFAYTLININADARPETLERIRSIDGVLSTRLIYQYDII